MVTLIWLTACGLFHREALESLPTVESSGWKSNLPWLLKSSAVCIKNIVSYQAHQTSATSSADCLGGEARREEHREKFNVGESLHVKCVNVCVFSRWALCLMARP